MFRLAPIMRTILPGPRSARRMMQSVGSSHVTSRKIKCSKGFGKTEISVVRTIGFTIWDYLFWLGGTLVTTRTGINAGIFSREKVEGSNTALMKLIRVFIVARVSDIMTNLLPKTKDLKIILLFWANVESGPRMGKLRVFWERVADYYQEMLRNCAKKAVCLTRGCEGRTRRDVVVRTGQPVSG